MKRYACNTCNLLYVQLADENPRPDHCPKLLCDGRLEEMREADNGAAEPQAMAREPLEFPPFRNKPYRYSLAARVAGSVGPDGEPVSGSGLALPGSRSSGPRRDQPEDAAERAGATLQSQAHLERHMERECEGTGSADVGNPSGNRPEVLPTILVMGGPTGSVEEVSEAGKAPRKRKLRQCEHCDQLADCKQVQWRKPVVAAGLPYRQLEWLCIECLAESAQVMHDILTTLMLEGP